MAEKLCFDCINSFHHSAPPHLAGTIKLWIARTQSVSKEECEICVEQAQLEVGK